jgi:TM2 domain-containing membrane protein YozV
MKRKKSTLLTYLFSLMPGAGQMYLGFMKQGITIMLAFLLTIATADFFHLNFIFAIVPVIWCYGFFDTINKVSLSPEELSLLEDTPPFQDLWADGAKAIKGNYRWLGIILMGLGGFLLFDNLILPSLDRLKLIDTYVARNYLRTIIASGLLIVLGVKLMTGKKTTPEIEVEEVQP